MNLQESLHTSLEKYAYPLLLLAVVTWAAWGVFPLLSYETDSQEFIMGCDLMYSEGWNLPPTYSYEYRMHPLTMLSVVAMRSLLPSLTCGQCYCLLSALSAFVFLVGTVELVRRFTQARRTTVLLSALLLPEMYAVAMYANTAIPAAACLVWAFVALAHRRYGAGGVLLVLAPLLRVDVVAVYPAILPLFVCTGHTLKKSMVLSAIYAVAVVALDSLLFWSLRADVLVSLTSYDYWNGRITAGQVLRAIFGFYSLTYLLLLPLGLLALVRRQHWQQLLLVLVPVVCLHYVYRSMGCAAKHYLYAAPFVIIAGVYALRLIRQALHGRRLLTAICTACCLLLFVLSVRIVPPGRPWFGQSTMYNGGLALPLCSATLPQGQVSIGIGAGQYVPTEDEYMLASGHLFYPWYIHTHKNFLKRCAETTAASLDSLPSFRLLAISYATRAPFISRCLNNGYRLNIIGDFEECTLTNDAKCISIRAFRFEADDNSMETFWRLIEDYGSAANADEVYVMVNMARYQYYLEMLARQKPLEKMSDMLYKYRLK